MVLIIAAMDFLGFSIMDFFMKSPKIKSEDITVKNIDADVEITECEMDGLYEDTGYVVTVRFRTEGWRLGYTGCKSLVCFFFAVIRTIGSKRWSK